MAKNCLIYETLHSVNEMRTAKDGDGLTHLKGVFGVCGVKNNNARIYEAGNYGKMVAEMRERLKTKPILGELEHPQTMNITLDNVSHKIVDINIDENGVVSGEIVLLNTPKGKLAQAIVEGGAPLFISSRAQGSVDPSTHMVTLENIATYDLVGSPGFSQAELHLNENQVIESLNESCVYIYDVNEEQTEENENEEKEQEIKDMNEQLLERLEALEEQINDLKEKNDYLQEQLDEREDIDLKKLCDGIQKWVIEQYSPEIQNYLVEQFAPEVQKWVVEQYSPEVQKWVVEQYSPEVQKWIIEQYSPEVQKWCQNDFATGIQNWFVDECAPAFEAWVTEHYGEEVKNQITEAVNASKKNSLSNIENTLSLLEGIQAPAKPTYGSKAKTLITENANSPKYLAEMPADARVKYDLASQDIKEAIDRRARLFDFKHNTVEQFWESVDFNSIKPVPAINESVNTVVNEREKAIRAQLSAWKARH